MANERRDEPRSREAPKPPGTDEIAVGERLLGRRISAEIPLEPDDARQVKALRWRRLHRIHIPILRLLGYGLLSAAVFLYNRYFARLGAEGEELALGFTLIAMVYAGAAWPLMYWGWGRLPQIDLVLLLTDVPLLVGAVYATGGESSWMVSLLLLRVADQAPYGSRRAFTFAAVVIFGFLALVTYLAHFEGRAIDWERELAKAILLAVASLYIALTARGSDLQRRRISRTMAFSRKLIEHLEKARDEAKAASVAKGQFLANMSHEIRTPLNAVVGISDLLLRDDLPETQRHRVELLQNSANALLGVLGDVLDFSKIEADRLVLESKPVDLDRLMGECRGLFEPLAMEKGIALTIRPDSGLPRIVGDEARLRQVLVNLLGNAFKFTSEGRIELETQQLDSDPPALRFEVEDSGIGIPQKALASLFDPFTQADASSSRQRSGSGLGLAICRRLVEAMGGQIGIDSEVGRGSRFWVEIPIEISDDPTPPATPTQAFEPLGGQVLLVEDNPVNRHVAVAMLEKLGIQATVAEDGRQALELFEPGRFDVILMDCQMPQLDGYAATREIRRLEVSGEPPIPILALTADAQEENRRRCLEAGMDDYLPKPLRIEVLHSHLARWLE